MEGSGRFILGNQAEALFVGGEWDEAEAIADDGLDHARRTGGTYHEPLFRFIQSELRLVRDGRADAAAASARQQIALARERADDQAIFPVFSGAAWILARTGNEAEAAALLDELLARRRANPTGLMAGGWTVHVALALERLGRSGELAELGERPASRFLEAALAIEDGHFEDAAQVLQEIGAPELEAEARLLAARAAADGRSHLARARELLHRLGATARLRELDSVGQVSD